jgi:amino acid adenylation domain-containing protein
VLDLDADLVDELRAVATAHQTSLDAVLVAALHSLLHRYTGERATTIALPAGAPVSSGNIAVATCIEATFDDNPPFTAVLAQVAKQLSSGSPPVQSCQVVFLGSALSGAADESARLSFGIAGAPARIGGLAFERLNSSDLPPAPELVMYAVAVEHELRCTLLYHGQQLDRMAAQDMLEHYRVLLANICKTPAEVVGRLPILSDVEREQFLVTWNQTGTAVPADRCIHELIEARATADPNGIAVTYYPLDGTDTALRLTYRELDDRANRLANWLRHLGVGPEVFVAVCLERSIELIVAIVAVLRAGGAYLPIDPTYPSARIAFMLADAGVRVVLTLGRARQHLPDGPARIVDLNEIRAEIEREENRPPEGGSMPQHPVYIIYTSGSTGRPKGVVIRHRSLVNEVWALQRLLPFRPSDRFVLNSSLSFDVSAAELFLPLAVGGQVVVADQATSVDADKLTTLVRLSEATLLQATPTVWRLLVDRGWIGSPSLTAVTAGEALPPRLASDLLSRTGRLWNLYGPTETTIYATGCEVTQSHPITIGRPLDNVRTYILDGYGQPTPIGIWGELHIGGVNVARCYHNRPTLTAEKFIADPFVADQEARLYRTGDFARYRRDGTIEFRGRIDHQIKIRGVRIEIGEIESVLAENEAVREVAVVAREDKPDQKELVAYIVANGTPPQPATLRSFLRGRLTDPMIPSAFVVLPMLPRSPTGKLDRGALLPPTKEAKPEGGATTVPEQAEPAGGVALLLSRIWADVLACERVGANANFFDLGGNSLTAMQIVSRVRDAMRIDLTVRDVFDQPTVAQLVVCIERAQPVKSEQTASRQEHALSFAQQRLWFLSQLDSDAPLYTMDIGIRLRGRLDVDLLGRSLHGVVARHSSLRTTFRNEDGAPVPVIRADFRPVLGFVDLSALDENEREKELARVTAVERARPFDLEKGPLLRAGLVHLASNHHVLLLTMHHIIADGWSVAILTHEMMEFYASLRDDRQPRLTPLPLSYGELSALHRQALTPHRMTRLLAFWKEQLADCPTVLDLWTDWPRPATQSFRGAVTMLTLGAPLARRIRQLARTEMTTPFVILLAAFHALLRRHIGAKDIIVGAPVSGRTRVETEPVIGLFLNTLALRSRGLDRVTFRDLVRQLRTTVLAAYDHQDLPIEILIEALKPERDASRTPLFQVFFNMLNLPDANAGTEGLNAELMGMVETTARFDLSLYASETSDDIQLHLVFASDLFREATATMLLNHFKKLLAGATLDPDQRLAAFPLWDEAERYEAQRRARELHLIDRGPTCEPIDVEQSLGQRFALVAQHHADRIAIESSIGAMTYGELDRASDQVARAICATCPDQGRPVALFLGHDVTMVIGILGALKTGRAYVPLDPLHPSDRLAYMLKEVEASEVVTDTEHYEAATRLAAMTGVPVIDAKRVPTSTAPLPSVPPDAHAYILYTSGSTGLPKGVLQNHRNVALHIKNYTENLGISCSDRLSLMSSYGFDAAVMDIFASLLTGATLCPIDPRRDALLDLFTVVRNKRVTVYHSTPTVFRHLVATGPKDCQFEDVRLVVLGGEQATRSDFDHFRRHFSSQAMLINGLGPTEATVALQCFMSPTTPIFGESLPVGHPVDGVGIRLLDSNGDDNEVWGEIGVRSRQVALGYWRRPDLTAEAFAADPLDPETRIYRTGDIGRRLPDGSILFLGRRDNQVKLRGHRVELGDVEAVLSRMPGVKEAVAAVQDNDAAARVLVAYIVPQTDTLTSVALRRWASQYLPSYMVPSVYVMVAALPTTPTGKIDRRSLPRAEFITRGAAYAAPINPVEDLLAGIWEEVLGVSRVGLRDNFFELGGHSLLATQVVSRVRSVFGVELPLRALFEAATLGELARRVAGAAASEGEVVRAGPRPVDVPLSFAQQRLWFLDQLEGEAASYTVPLALRLRGVLEVAALERALRGVMARHETLRTSFPAQDGVAVQVVRPIEAFDLSREDLSERAPAQREAALAERLTQLARHCFNLTHGLPVIAVLVRLAAEEHVLAVVVHHIAFDGWSTGLFFTELAALYRAALAGGEPELTRLPLQYADFALWQRRRLSREHGPAEHDLAYWRAALAGAPEELTLPTDRARPAVRRQRGARLPVRLEPELVEGLRALGRRQGVTLFMVLQAALAAVLGRWSGQDDVLIGTPVANRTRQELEGLIGFFVNTLVLRTRLMGDPRLCELLAQVRETAVAAYAHQELPFEQLVEALQPARALDRTPLFQVMLVLQSAPTVPVVLSGLDVERLSVETGTTKFDLTLALDESSDGGLLGELAYDTDLFEAATVARLASHVERVLARMVAQPEARLSELVQLSAAERRQIIEDWNATTRAVPTATLPELFAAQVSRTPDAIAVVFGQQRLSYAELAARSRSLAYRLRRQGVGADVVVGLFVERSLEMVVALVAILEAGGAYLALDPEQTPRRLAAMLEDAEPLVIVAQDHLVDRLPPTDIRILPLSVAAVDDVEAVPLTPAGHGADKLAYVSFTSGSTGRPKGIAVTHRNVMRLVKAANFMSLDAATTFLQLAPLAFDASTLEIWGPLLNGGRLVVMPPRQPTLEELGRALIKHQVNALWLSAGLFQAMAEERPGDFAPIRHLLAGGDVLSATHVRNVLKAHPGLTLINGYGPTENTTFTCCYRMTEPGQVGESVPIGMPIGATQVYVLDAWLRPVPIGVAGELYAGGDGLARGYLNQPALTAERFVANPFGPPGSRLYRTGDRARWRADGVIEFLGRLDHQVKIRGFRVEPGEVEAALVGLPGVGEAVVVARSEKGTVRQMPSRRLVAYVVPRQGQASTVSELRRALKERLPDYMLPADFVLLAALPLTANGKIDRRALPTSETTTGAAETDFIAPRNELEQKLQAIWQDLLGVPRIGMRDSFFELGGHSLLAVRLFSRIRKLTGHDLPLATLFKFATIESLAELLGESRAFDGPRLPASTSIEVSQPWSPLVEITKGAGRWPLFCVHNADGNVLNYYNLARHLGPDRTVYGLQAQGSDGRHAPLSRIEEMAALYLPFVRKVQATGPYFFAGHSGGGVVAFEMAQQLMREGEEVALLALLDTLHPSVATRELTLRQRLQVARQRGTPVKILPSLMPWLARRIGRRAMKVRRARQLAQDGMSIPHHLREVFIFDAFATALRAYRPERYSNKIYLLQATAGDLGRVLGFDHGWTGVPEKGLEVRDVPGTHLAMMYEPNVGAVATILRAIIDAEMTKHGLTTSLST